MDLGLPPLGVDKNLPILKKDRLSTGIRELDIILEGGYRNPGTVLIKGPPGIEKAAFSFHFASAGKNDFVVFIAADAAPESIREKASSVGIPLGEDVNFIDCYSATLSNQAKPPDNPKCISVPGPSALNDLSLAINEMMKRASGKKMRVIFYSLSAFLLYNPKESILKFLRVINGRLKNSNATIIFLVEEGVHERGLIGSIERLMDERFEILMNKQGCFELSIAELGVPVNIKIGPSGIMIP